MLRPLDSLRLALLASIHFTAGGCQRRLGSGKAVASSIRGLESGSIEGILVSPNDVYRP